jgi:hypothetical protein
MHARNTPRQRFMLTIWKISASRAPKELPPLPAARLSELRTASCGSPKMVSYSHSSCYLETTIQDIVEDLFLYPKMCVKTLAK